MDLLLFLSAFLTALTGAITGVRPVQAVAQEQVVERAARQAAIVVQAHVSRPLQGWPALPRNGSVANRPLPLATTVPVYAQRRRE